MIKQGNIVKIKEIVKTIQDDGLKPSVQTYAAVLECLGRLAPTSINKAQIASYIDQMQMDVRKQILFLALCKKQYLKRIKSLF